MMRAAVKQIVSALCAMALLLLPSSSADAILLSGASSGGGGGGTLLTTMTLVNTSGSTQATNFVTDIFGHPFKKGDIANGCSGGGPQFQLTNGTNVPFSEGLNPTCWSDGSLKWAPFMLRVPTSIAGSGSLTINILSGGSTPVASSRSLSDFATASTDLNVSVTGESLGNLSGVWVSNLNQGIGAAHTDDYHYMGGQAGDVWRVRASFRQSSADHGQLEAYWYVQALQDNSGGLYGLRYLPRIVQPWYNIDSPTKNWRAFSAMTVNNSASVLRDVFASQYGSSGAKAFTFNNAGAPCNVSGGSAPFTCSDLNATANGFLDHNYIRLTNSGGALPQNATFTAHIAGTTLTIDSGVTGNIQPGTEITSGAAAGTIITDGCCGGVGGVYTVSISQTVSSTAMIGSLSSSVPYFTFAVGQTSANTTVQACTNSADCGTGAGIPLITNCTGTCTATAYPYIAQFSSLYPMGSTGKPDYIQAGGSVSADHTTRIQFDRAYWRATKMIPPYNYSNVSPSAATLYSFQIQGHGPISLGTGGTGERDDIGPETAWAVRHFYNQDANSTQTLRTIALEGGQVPIFIRNHTTYTIPVVNNGPTGSGTTYTGMPAVNINWTWRGTGGTTVGFTAPTNTNVLIPLFNSITFDHFPELWYYPLLVFGEPQFSDDGASWGNHAVETVVGPTGNSAIVNANTNAIAGLGSNPGLRDSIINGVHYYGMFLNFVSGVRGTAWAARSGGQAAALKGYEPNSASTYQYLNDNVAATYAGYMRYIAMLPSYTQDNGFWYEPISTDGWGAMWQYNYMLQATAYTAAITENSDAVSFASHGAKFHKFIQNNFGAWSIPFYYAQNRTGTTDTPSGNSSTNPYLTAATQWGLGGCQSAGGEFRLTWTNGSATFTMDTPGGTDNYVPTNGDYVRFFDNCPNSTPGTFSGYTSYYMVNAGVGGTYKFGLASTAGGSPITPNDSQTSKDFQLGALVFGPAHTTTTISGTNGLGDGYMSNALGTLRWISAVGGTVDSTVLSAEATALTSYAGYSAAWNSAPRYTFCPTYTAACLVPVNDNDTEFLPRWKKAGGQ